MKFGVLDFSYSGFEFFERSLKEPGCFTTNLGDNAQTIASRHLFRTLGIPDTDIVPIDRDTLPHYSGERVLLLMNGVFRESGFPIPESVTPLFAGFTAGENVVARHHDWIRRYEPIGCRDSDTTRMLQRLGIQAFTTGCVTLTLPRRAQTPEQRKLIIVYGSGAGALPQGLLKFVPPELLDTAEFVFNRLPTSHYPLPELQRRHAETYAIELLRQFREHATLVLTPLHHVAAPCMAMGVPVVICRNDQDSRFSFLREILPVYEPQDFSRIEWNPEVVDVGAHACAFAEAVRTSISRCTSHR